MKPTLLILAAGIGSRYGGLKQLDKIGPGGETIVDYSIYDALRAGFGEILFVIKKSIEDDFKEAFINKLQSRMPVGYVFQERENVPEDISWSPDRQKPWGTGHAVLMAAGRITTPFAVINSDDFYGPDSYKSLAAYYHGWTPGRGNDFCMVGYKVENTLSEFGTVSRGVCTVDEQSNLAGVVERTRIEQRQEGIGYWDEENRFNLLPHGSVVSMNFWGFTPEFFSHLESGFHSFIKEKAFDLKAEYYIPTAVNNLITSGTATVRVLDCNEKWFGMTYKEDREKVVGSIRSLVQKGIYPGNLWG